MTEANWKCRGNDEKHCEIIIPDSFNRKYLPHNKITPYEKKLCVAYAENNKAIRWCPAPDCIFCVENPNLGATPIVCKCTYIYCFECGEEDHQPCDCKRASDWQSKNKSDSENTHWILSNTKICPICELIEINKQSEICWVCLKDFKEDQGRNYRYKLLSDVKSC